MWMMDRSSKHRKWMNVEMKRLFNYICIETLEPMHVRHIQRGTPSNQFTLFSRKEKSYSVFGNIFRSLHDDFHDDLSPAHAWLSAASLTSGGAVFCRDSV